MVLTRATDNRLKTLFTGGEVRYGDAAFQGKGFRSLGQEAIYASAIRLRRGESYLEDGEWRGDVIAPVIRDLGAALAMRPTADMVRSVLAAQMGKAGPPMQGKDLHVGNFDAGILPAAAPLAIGTLTIAGMALAFAREQGPPSTPRETGPSTPPEAGPSTAPRASRVAVSYIGEGGSSLGEWHEAINLCAARRLPAVFCVENNQTALSTPLRDQSAVRVFADKALGYGIPGITIDGTDPDEIAAAFAWAVERARDGRGPSLLELVSMRMCGHAHHDDMLYLGKDAAPGWEYPPLVPPGYADADLYAFWSARDPIPAYAARLEAEGVIAPGDLDALKKDCEALVNAEAEAVIAAPWPDAADAGSGVFAGGERRTRVEVLDPQVRPRLDRRGAAGDRSRTALRADRHDVSRGGDARRRRRAARRSARVRVRRRRRRCLRQRLPAAAAAARGVRRSPDQFTARRGRRARRVASAPRSPGSGRSARCSSTTSSPPASTSW